MPSLKDLLELMGSSWPIALGILLASSGLLYADHLALSYVSTLPTWAPGTAFIAALLSASVLTVSAIKYGIRLASRPFAKRRRLLQQSEHVNGLADLPDEERWLLAWAVANRTQVFSAPYFDPKIKALLARGYVFVPHGNHSVLETPLQIPDHIWQGLKAILKNEDLSKLVGRRPFDRW